MRIFMSWCPYIIRGGEDQSTELEIAALTAAGHEVLTFPVRNSGTPRWQAVTRQFLSLKVFRTVRAALRAADADVVHFQNLSWALGPSAILAAKSLGLPIVVSIRNERLLYGWREVWQRAYNGSLAQTLVLAAGNRYHRMMGTWCAVTVFVPTSDYLSRKMDEAGFAPRVRRIVKPNMARIAMPPPVHRANVLFAPPVPVPIRQFLFVGRMAPEKGLKVLLAAWELLSVSLGNATPKLLLIGPSDRDQGWMHPPMHFGPNIMWIGPRSHEQVLLEMARSIAVVVPSTWAEPFGRVAVEALSCYTPTIVSATGGLLETRPTVAVGPSKPEALAAACKQMLDQFDNHHGAYLELRAQAGASFAEHFATAKLVEAQLAIYRFVMENGDDPDHVP